MERIVLTETDRAVLESYKNLLEGLSSYLGNAYEFVLHSLENYDHSVIKIINGFHTCRVEGAPITDFALSMLEKIQKQNSAGGNITYFSQNRAGAPLKSSTITIAGEGGRIIGLLCINFYLNTPFNDILSSYTSVSGEAEHAAMESFAGSIEELIEDSISEVYTAVLTDKNVPSSCRNKEIVRRLWDKGVFRLKDAVNKTADYLNISKNTVYMHIRNLNNIEK